MLWAKLHFTQEQFQWKWKPVNRKPFKLKAISYWYWEEWKKKNEMWFQVDFLVFSQAHFWTLKGKDKKINHFYFTGKPVWEEKKKTKWNWNEYVNNGHLITMNTSIKIILS